MQLSWEQPVPEDRNGIIRQYIVHVDLPVEEVTSYTTGSTSYIVSGLRPFTNYSFSVAAITTGEGPTTEQVSAQTFSDGKYAWEHWLLVVILYSIGTVPGGPPLLVTAQPLDPTSLSLSWKPPLLELRNGIIQLYTVKIIELETGILLSQTTEFTSLNETSLHPYYTYTYSVAAETSVGIGPFSSSVVIQLPESGMYNRILRHSICLHHLISQLLLVLHLMSLTVKPLPLVSCFPGMLHHLNITMELSATTP